MATSVSRAATTASPDLLAAAAATSTNPIVLREPEAGKPRKRVGYRRRRQFEYRRLRYRHQRQSRHDGHFKINTNSSNYRIDIYRLGYYGGMGARKVATIQHTGVQNQPAPLAMRQPAWSMPATGLFPHPGTFRRMPSRASTSQSSCVRTALQAKIKFRLSSGTTAATATSSSRPRIKPGRPTMAGAEQISMAATVLRRVKVRARLRGQLQPSDRHPRRRRYLCRPAGLFVRRRICGDLVAGAERL